MLRAGNPFKEEVAVSRKSSRPIRIEDVRSFWNANPLCASMIPYPLGSKEYFEYYDNLREANESLEFSYRLHEYKQFADRRVLDVGCGNGYVLAKYAQEGADVHGVDISPTAVDLCFRRFELLGLKGNFQEANAEDLPFESNFFDCVCSMGVLHHVPNPEMAVHEIFRVLKPGGRLIVMVYHRNSALYRLGFSLKSLLGKQTIQQLVNEYDGVGNPKGEVYSTSELRYLLSQFEQLQMFAGYLRRGMVPIIGRFIPISLLRLFERQWGWFLYAKGIKP